MNQKVNPETVQKEKHNHLESVLNLMDHFAESNITQLDLEVEGLKIFLQKEVKEIIHTIPQPQAIQPAVQLPNVSQTQIVAVNNETIEVKQESNLKEIKAPLVGTFYGSNAPGAKAFVSVGDTVKKGQPICIIEAMKVMNEIESPYDGVVKEIKVVNEEAIGFDQVLMLIEI